MAVGQSDVSSGQTANEPTNNCNTRSRADAHLEKVYGESPQQLFLRQAILYTTTFV